MRLWKMPSNRRIKRMNNRLLKRYHVAMYSVPIMELIIDTSGVDKSLDEDLINDYLIEQAEANDLYGTWSFGIKDDCFDMVLDYKYAYKPDWINNKIDELKKAVRNIKFYEGMKPLRYRIVDAWYCDDGEEIIYEYWREL